MSLDVAVALAAAIGAAAWLVVRSVRTLRGTPAGCGCGKPETAPCPQASSIADAVRAGARRRARSPSRSAPPGA